MNPRQRVQHSAGVAPSAATDAVLKPADPLPHESSCPGTCGDLSDGRTLLYDSLRVYIGIVCYFGRRREYNDALAHQRWTIAVILIIQPTCSRPNEHATAELPSAGATNALDRLLQ